MRLVILSLAFISLIAVACEEPLEKFENQAPYPFATQSVLINDTTAKVTWTPAIDPDKDSVVYDVYFMGQAVFANLRTTTYTFTNLQRGRAYSGSIVARDAFFQETSAAFNFVTVPQDTTGGN